MDSPLANIDRGEMAKAQAISITVLNSDPYYTAANGLMAARVIDAWRKAKWSEQTFNCHALHIMGRTFRQKLKAGIAWNVGHAADQATRDFWVGIQGSIRFNVRNNIVTISRPADVLAVMETSTDIEFINLQADLTDWMPFATVGKSWHKRGINLTPEQIKWFKDHLNLPRNMHTFVGAIHPTEIKIVRTSERFDPTL